MFRPGCAAPPRRTAQLVEAALEDLRRPLRVLEQGAADGDQVELVALQAVEEVVDAPDRGALADEGRG